MFESSISAEFTMGLRLVAMLTAMAGLACGGPDGASEGARSDEKPQVLLIGIDGTDLRWIDRLSSAGRLPNFDSLMQRGSAEVVRRGLAPFPDPDSTFDLA